MAPIPEHVATMARKGIKARMETLASTETTEMMEATVVMVRTENPAGRVKPAATEDEASLVRPVRALLVAHAEEWEVKVALRELVGLEVLAAHGVDLAVSAAGVVSVDGAASVAPVA